MLSMRIIFSENMKIMVENQLIPFAPDTVTLALKRGGKQVTRNLLYQPRWRHITLAFRRFVLCIKHNTDRWAL